MTIRGLTSEFWCPISLEPMVNPVTTPCGHTFDDVYIKQHLERDFTCPIDRNPLLPEQLRANIIAEQQLANISQLVSIFIGTHPFSPYFEQRCKISRKPLLSDSTSLPCTHSFDESSLVKWSLFRLHPQDSFDSPYTLDSLKNREWMVSCPLCNNAYSPEEVRRGTAEFEQNNRKEYAQYLDQLSLFNLNLNKKTRDLKLDDRGLIQAQFDCPLSGKQFTHPVLAPCGHTFDRSSITLSALCPFDATPLSVDNVVPNLLVSSCLEKMNQVFDSIFCGLDDEREINGVWLHLEQNSTPEKVYNIARQLGFCSPNTYHLVTLKNKRTIDQPLRLLDLQENPVLLRINSKLY